MRANGLEVQKVPADGDCFFHASSIHTEGHDSTTLRGALCDYVRDNMDEYIHYFPMPNEPTDAKSFMSFANDSISDMRQMGKWDSVVGDIMPHALANFTGRKVKIISSNQTKGILNINPSNGDAISPCIYLVYFDIQGRQHYDGCKRKVTSELYTTVFDNLFPADAVSSNHDQQESLKTTPSYSHQPSTSTHEPSTSTHEPSTSTHEPSTPPGNSCMRRNSSSSDDTIIVYNTPQKKTPPRKRKAKPDQWKKNSRKSLKLHGQEYTTSRGKPQRKKQVQEIECDCKFKCSEAINKNERSDIFKTYYDLGEYNLQKNFVCSHVSQSQTKTVLDNATMTPISKRKQVTRQYHLTSCSGDRIQVCKKFFLKTLDIGQGYVDHALKNSKNGAFVGEDGRGKHTPANKVSEQDKTRVKNHIESFPAVESHYCRQRSRRRFLDSNLTVNKMYQFYSDYCEEHGYLRVSSSYYREVFNTEYNLGFHRPKKDQCLTCHRYIEGKKINNLTEEQVHDYEDHQRRKVEAREEKEKDKKLSMKSSEIHTATFDIQKVLSTPCSLVSQVYYKRKLAVYNLTVNSLSDREVQCYVWDETNGKRGSCEVGTCLYRYINSLPSTISHIIFYSDTCGGQNRNQYIASCLYNLVHTNQNINIIDQKFLESGHSQMECDSVHSTIERAAKNASVYSPDQWQMLIQLARTTPKPYNVVPLDYKDILDFKHLASELLRNTKTDSRGGRVQWLISSGSDILKMMTFYSSMT